MTGKKLFAFRFWTVGVTSPPDKLFRAASWQDVMNYCRAHDARFREFVEAHDSANEAEFLTGWGAEGESHYSISEAAVVEVGPQ